MSSRIAFAIGCAVVIASSGIAAVNQQPSISTTHRGAGDCNCQWSQTGTRSCIKFASTPDEDCPTTTECGGLYPHLFDGICQGVPDIQNPCSEQAIDKLNDPNCAPSPAWVCSTVSPC